MKDMVSKSHAKRRQDIKTKLMAAIAMLLVSSIMMVSSTYAWFTLSTAPEVTGITTAVGANGNLEMKLQPLNGDSSAESTTGDSIATIATHSANTTWGNLVDLTATDAYTYGLEEIVLYPSALNLSDGKVGAFPLSTPEYGADGRVSDLVEKTITGVYNNTEQKFIQGDTDRGVRAIGISSGMTDRQIAYRKAISDASTAASKANRLASQTLNTNGASLADIAIKHATSDGNETYTDAELGYIVTITNDLLGYDVGEVHTTGVLEYIEEALVKYGLATVLAECTDDQYANIVNEFKTVTIDNLQTKLTEKNAANAGITNEVINKLKEMKSDVATAKSTVETEIAKASDAKWTDFSSAVSTIADPERMKVNGILVSELKEKMGDLVSKVLADGGLKLVLETGAGVFADIADFGGDYAANVSLSKVEYGDMKVENLSATMSTKTSQNPLHLTYVASNVTAFNAGGSAGASVAISDYYGYIIDLAFRTNVAESYLQLQQTGIDRIYSDADGRNEDTMGGGASMSFTSVDPQFNGAEVEALMRHLRIVFFETDSGVVYGYARLDPASKVADASGKVTMNLAMCDEAGVFRTEDQNIIKLEQNQIHELSVMVYLDGTAVTNKDVANAAQSLSGSMNLQFSSTAPLTPMEYSDLREGDENNVKDYGKDGTQTPATPSVTPLANPTVTGGNATGAVYVVADGQGYIVVLGATATGSAEINAVTINGSNATNGTYGGQSGWAIKVSEQPTTAATVVINP